MNLTTALNSVPGVGLPLNIRQLQVHVDALLPRRRLEAEGPLLLLPGDGRQLQEVARQHELYPAERAIVAPHRSGDSLLCGTIQDDPSG